MALHAMAFLCKEGHKDLNIILVDGSLSRDEELAKGVKTLGVGYLHFGREFSFAETYNAGMRRASNPVVVTRANNILIEAKQIGQLAEEA